MFETRLVAVRSLEFRFDVGRGLPLSKLPPVHDGGEIRGLGGERRRFYILN
jgi:hypothetical protein